MSELIKTYYKQAIASLSYWYWSLDPKRRHKVGWTLLIASILVLGGSLWGIGYGVYGVCVWTKVTVQGWFSDEVPETESGDTGFTNFPLYSGNNRHRQFECGELNRKRYVNCKRMFNDINDTQLAAARKLGIKPLESREEFERAKSRLIELRNTRYYKVDKMTHSVPYVVPDVSDFLTSLGERWTQYHGGNCRFVITSCLRTVDDIKKLRRSNVNSTKESCHRYATTIDIAYYRYDNLSKIHEGKLKDDLARALYDMREAGYCYVKYEDRQSCFHITVRPR